MTTISYPLRINERIMPLVNLKAKEEYIDKSAALRRLLYQGVEDYVMELYKEGRLSAENIAEMLDKSIYDIHRLIQKRNIRVEHSDTIYRKSRETAKKLF